MVIGENFVNEDGIVFNPNQSDFAADANNIMYDSDGNVESIYDPDSGKTYRNKVEGTPEETPEEKATRIAGGGETEEEKATRIAAGTETPEEIIAREKLEKETPEEKLAREKKEAEKAAPEYINSADYVLKLSGYDNDEIELESGKKKISDLTPEEQMSVIVQEYDNIREGREAAIAKVKEEASDNFYQNDGEKEIITYLREKGDVVELAKYILENSPSIVADMSDEDAVSKQLRDDFPEYTAEEIEEEIELLKGSGRLEKRATMVRAKYKDKDMDISDLSTKLGLKNSETVATEKAAHQTKMTEFVEYAKAEKEIAGIPMSDEIRDYLISGIVTEDPTTKTDFVKSLEDPKKLMRLRFLDTYFEKIMESTQKNFFSKGKKVGDNIIKKFSASPIVLAGSNNDKNKIKQPTSIDEVDVDKMVEEAEKIF